MTDVAERGAAEPAVDWTAIERSEAFQELTRSRRGFSAKAGAFGIGTGLLYIVLSQVAPDLMGTQVLGDMSLGFLGGVLLILLTMAITWLYMRRSAKVWAPMEERVRREAGA
jgi:uncharacterized membrane protein (DUF485 family)